MRRADTVVSRPRATLLYRVSTSKRMMLPRPRSVMLPSARPAHRPVEHNSTDAQRAWAECGMCRASECDSPRPGVHLKNAKAVSLTAASLGHVIETKTSAAATSDTNVSSQQW